MTRKHTLRIDPEPHETSPDRDPAACLRRASEYLALGGLAEAAHYTRLAAQLIEKKQAH
jgi:hypothetical protein